MDTLYARGGLLRNHAALNTSKEKQSMPVLRFAKNQNNSYCSHAIISKSTIDMVIVVIHTFVTDTENTDQLYIIVWILIIEQALINNKGQT